MGFFRRGGACDVAEVERAQKRIEGGFSHGDTQFQARAARERLSIDKHEMSE
jgi:hypothetical protein